MSKDKKYFGIDISATGLDVYDYSGNFHQFSNDFKGFKEFFKLLDRESLCDGSYGILPHQVGLLFGRKRSISFNRKTIEDKTIYPNGIIKNKNG